MKIHYFQRYHSKENVDTANTILLFSRLYSYSPNKFFGFIKEYILPENIDPQLTFNLQKKCKNSIPDATIIQPSFNITIETKLNGQFYIKQLLNHLNSFKNEDNKILLTLDPNPMKRDMLIEFESKLSDYNKANQTRIIHKNMTFKMIIEGVRAIIDERDFEIIDVLSDYEEYCIEENLIPNTWQRMRVQLAGTTLNINQKLNLYYDRVDRGFSGHDYLGLYSNKSVRAIGKITDIIVAEKTKQCYEYTIEKGVLTEEMKERINIAVNDAVNYGYLLDNTRYFFVDKFYDTNFVKVTPYAPMGTRIFDLTEVLGIDILPETSKIAEMLNNKSWK